jgi:hypothetical protein
VDYTHKNDKHRNEKLSKCAAPKDPKLSYAALQTQDTEQNFFSLLKTKLPEEERKTQCPFAAQQVSLHQTKPYNLFVKTQRKRSITTPGKHLKQMQQSGAYGFIRR